MNEFEKQQIDKKFSEIDQDIAQEQKLNLLSLRELMSKKFKDAEWVIEKLIPSSGITAISGAPISYKTWIILEIAIKVAKNEILFDNFPVSQTGILIIDEESGERLLQKRMKKLCKDFELPIYFLSLKSFKVFPEENIRKIIKTSKKNKIKLVILDSLIRIHDKDENSANEMAKVFSALRKLNSKGIAVIFTHHNRKQSMFRGRISENMRGSSDILASVDSHLAVERNDNQITINHTKSRYEKEVPPFKLEVKDDETKMEFEYLGEIDEKETKQGEAKVYIKKLLSESKFLLYKSQIINKVKLMASTDKSFLGSDSAQKGLGDLIEKGEVFTIQGNKQNKIYCGLSGQKYQNPEEENQNLNI